MRSGSVLSTRERVADAVDEASERLSAELGTWPDVLFVFASRRLRGDLDALPARASERLGAPLVCGCVSDGVIGTGREVERAPALSMLGLVMPEGALALPVRIEPGERKLPTGRRPTGAVLLPDPFSTDLDGLLRRFDATAPGVPLLGGVPSGARRPGEHRLFLEGWTFRDGAVGVSFSGRVHLEAAVAQSCRPIGEPMIVTRADGPRILELDRGRPADVLRDLAPGLPPEDRVRMREGLLCGVEMRSTQIEYGPGDFLIRDVLRIEADGGAMVVAADLDEYAVVQLHVRDQATAAADLVRALGPLEAGAADSAGVLMFSSASRGAALHGAPGHDASLLAERLGPVPTCGLFGDGEIGPVGGTTYLHARTSAIAVLRASRRGVRTDPGLRGRGLAARGCAPVTGAEPEDPRR
jgi:small ligand-binding sensory domain FIST